jgi:hypothetical protein
MSVCKVSFVVIDACLLLSSSCSIHYTALVVAAVISVHVIYHVTGRNY